MNFVKAIGGPSMLFDIDKWATRLSDPCGIFGNLVDEGVGHL